MEPLANVAVVALPVMASGRPAQQRSNGVETLAMSEIARENDCEELCLGTEVENIAANTLYQFLGPDEIAQVVGYTYEADE